MNNNVVLDNYTPSNLCDDRRYRSILPLGNYVEAGDKRRFVHHSGVTSTFPDTNRRPTGTSRRLYLPSRTSSQFHLEDSTKLRSPFVTDKLVSEHFRSSQSPPSDLRSDCSDLAVILGQGPIKCDNPQRAALNHLRPQKKRAEFMREMQEERNRNNIRAKESYRYEENIKRYEANLEKFNALPANRLDLKPKRLSNKSTRRFRNTIRPTLQQNTTSISPLELDPPSHCTTSHVKAGSICRPSVNEDLVELKLLLEDMKTMNLHDLKVQSKIASNCNNDSNVGQKTTYLCGRNAFGSKNESAEMKNCRPNYTPQEGNLHFGESPCDHKADEKNCRIESRKRSTTRRQRSFVTYPFIASKDIQKLELLPLPFQHSGGPCHVVNKMSSIVRDQNKFYSEGSNSVNYPQDASTCSRKKDTCDQNFNVSCKDSVTTFRSDELLVNASSILNDMIYEMMARSIPKRQQGEKADVLNDALLVHRSFPKAMLHIVNLLPGNDKCVKCGEDRPVWASTDLGTVCCKNCAFREERNVQSKKSRHAECTMKSLFDDDTQWNLREIITMLEGGNASFMRYVKRELEIGQSCLSLDWEDKFASSEVASLYHGLLSKRVFKVFEASSAVYNKYQ